MKKRKSYLIIAAVILAAAVAALLLIRQSVRPEIRSQESEAETDKSTAAATAEEPMVTETVTEKPVQTEQSAEDKSLLEKEQPFLVQITEDDPSIAYVLVRMQNAAGLLPLPVDGEYTRTIRQKNGDGSEMTNVLHLTKNGFWMESANCEGQDCVNMGEVTLENREERILGNMIICLPNQVMLQLYSLEELLEFAQSESAQ